MDNGIERLGKAREERSGLTELRTHSRPKAPNKKGGGKGSLSPQQKRFKKKKKKGVWDAGAIRTLRAW